MTACLFLALIGFSSALAAVRSQQSGRSSTAVRWLILATLAWLPMCFGPLTSISHIVFEATSEWQFWPGLAICLLLAGSALRTSLSVRTANGHALEFWVLLGVSAGTLAVLTGVPVHGHETGSTPTLATSPFHAATWLFSCAAVLALIVAIRAAMLRGTMIRAVVPAMLTGLLLLAALSSVR
jgi:hypothetical protein